MSVRQDLLPLSASALVVGVMCLLLGVALNPGEGGTAQETVRIVQEDGGRWLAMSVMYFLASVAMVLGLPAIVSLFDRRGRRLGTLATAIFAVGVIGTTGFAMLMVFFRALVQSGGVRQRSLEGAAHDLGLSIFLYGWITGFYVGVLLLGVALLLSRTTPRWVPVLLLLFVAAFPFGSMIGRVGQVVQVLLLAVAFTGMAIASVDRSHGDRRAAGLSAQPLYP